MTDFKSMRDALDAAGGVVQTKVAKPKRRPDTGIFLRADKAVVKQFHVLMVEQDKKQYELAAEALNLLFKKYGKPPIAQE
jgi:hypothetical protein